jgi:hypothetical protein
MGPLPTLRNIMSSSLFICQILRKSLKMPSQVEATLLWFIKGIVSETQSSNWESLSFATFQCSIFNVHHLLSYYTQFPKQFSILHVGFRRTPSVKFK